MSARRIGGEDLLDELESGRLRVAERDADGTWHVHGWIREELLEIFRRSPVEPCGEGPRARFLDKRALPLRSFTVEDGVRVVPGGSAVRRGAHLGRGVVCMPPMYVNVGAFVGAGTMVDSHALVGSCAQVGERVHVSAACQIGGVLEPVGALPVIVEDDVLLGGGSGIYEGVLVRAGAVIAAGTVLTASSVLYDLVHERELRTGEGASLEVPERAVVVPGTRPARGDWAGERDLAVACALIVKYRDEGTDRRTALESALR